MFDHLSINLEIHSGFMHKHRCSGCHFPPQGKNLYFFSLAPPHGALSGPHTGPADLEAELLLCFPPTYSPGQSLGLSTAPSIGDVYNHTGVSSSVQRMVSDFLRIHFSTLLEIFLSNSDCTSCEIFGGTEWGERASSLS